MTRNTILIRNSIYKLVIVVLTFVVTFSLLMGHFESINFITVFSLILYLVILIFSLYKKKYFYISLIIVTLFFPSAVNNLFPSFETLGSYGELKLIPIITHVDIFLIFNLIRYKYSYINVNNKLLLFSICILFLSTIINLFFIDSIEEIKALSYGTYNIRFLIYFLFIPLQDVLRHKREIGLSLFIGILFILIESVMFTFLNGNERLASGSLATNTFGNLLAAFLVLMLFSDKILENNKRLILIFILILGVLLTGNRTSLFVFVLVCMTIIFIKPHMRKYLLYLPLVFLLILATMYSLKVDFSRYNIFEISENISYSSNAGIEIERIGVTSSLYTRFLLYNTSIEMIKSKPVIGIGNGTWNDKKAEYGFTKHVLIDSHNSYLTILSQFGLLSIFYIFLIYIRPSIMYLKKMRLNNFVNDFNLIILFFFFAAFFNSDINKYQVAAFLSFIVIMNLQNNKI